MKEIRLRLILILAFTALSIYLLYPTYADYQNSKKISGILERTRADLKANNPGLTTAQIESRLAALEDSLKAADPDIVKDKQKRLKLGLDLQGGMRIVLEVNTLKMIQKIAKNPNEVFNQVIKETEKEASVSDESVADIIAAKFKDRNIRLSRFFGTVKDEDADIVKELNKATEDAVSRAIEIIRNRVDQYGVSEPSIQRQGSRRIIVELPGVAREEEARQLLQGTALLEFKLVKDPQFTFSVMQKIDKVLAGNPIQDTTKADSSAALNGKGNKDTSSTAADTTSGKQLTEEQFKKAHPFFAIARINQQSADAFVKADEREKLQRIFNRPDVKKVLPDNVEFVFEAKPVGEKVQGIDFYRMILVNKKPELTGGVITDADANIDPGTSAPIVNMTMNSEGSTDWARITGANKDKRIAIILDGVSYSSPVVKNRITGGRSQIEGMANMEEAKLLAIVLKAGALPAPVDIIEERTVGPSLGQDSIKDGLFSGIIGFFLTATFMIVYYRRSGSIAAVSLIFTVLFIMGILAGFSATLTLPGIAGIILTVAMAVDSNVLIYERIREELAVGKTMKASVDSGFSRALSAIVDSNLTTFFSGIILYQFGSGPVQGFALTLMIGIVASMFSALVICRVILNYMVSAGIKITV
ncbi:MAG TPA: protein translocase subunit SecD [Ignavibacteriaceae bacterium]|nr:protein translocase subunit SecD [Ignavibacteriaceae bacterium]